MWTTRDQIQAYQFLRRRVVSALQTGDANSTTPPSRRLLLAYAVGIACTLLTVAAFGFVGLLHR